MRYLVISVLISLDQELSENIWFVWSKTSYSGDVTPVTDDGHTHTHWKVEQYSAEAESAITF